MADETGTATEKPATGNGDAGNSGVDTQNQGGTGDTGKGSTVNAGATNPLSEQVGDDAATRDWLNKQTERAKDIPSLAKLAASQDKMLGELTTKLGNAIVPPGKDAKPEEIAAYKAKMDIGASADDYKFEAPKNLPEGLPYDGERAKSFAAKAAEIGLTKAQAKAVHDWATENAVGDFNTSKEQTNQQKVETAKAETAKLVKLWGPLTGETFKANAAFADKALMEVGGQAALDEFQRVGLIGNEGGTKVIQSEAIATMLAKFGRAVFQEGEVLRGDPAMLNNPFAEGPDFNVTRQMQLINQNRQQAMSFIAAAGKKPSDFGLSN